MKACSLGDGWIIQLNRNFKFIFTVISQSPTSHILQFSLACVAGGIESVREISYDKQAAKPRGEWGEGLYAKTRMLCQQTLFIKFASTRQNFILRSP